MKEKRFEKRFKKGEERRGHTAGIEVAQDVELPPSPEVVLSLLSGSCHPCLVVVLGEGVTTVVAGMASSVARVSFIILLSSWQRPGWERQELRQLRRR